MLFACVSDVAVFDQQEVLRRCVETSCFHRIQEVSMLPIAGNCAELSDLAKHGLPWRLFPPTCLYPFPTACNARDLRRHHLSLVVHHLDEYERLADGNATIFIGLGNYSMLATEQPLPGDHTAYPLLHNIKHYCAGSARRIRCRGVSPALSRSAGCCESIYILPMMTTPVAIALVFIMMYHPQLGILNYLLSLVGIPMQLWIYEQGPVIPALVLG